MLGSLTRVALSILFLSVPASSFENSFNTIVGYNDENFDAYDNPAPVQVSKNDVIDDITSKISLLSTGTTICGVCCKEGVVLGADTRSTGGPMVMDKNKLKIHYIAPKIYCCAAGTSADCDHITRTARHYISLHRIENDLAGCSQSFDAVPTALVAIRKCLNRGGRKPQSSMIIGGFDGHGPSLYQIGTDGVPQRVSLAALGSGSTDAIAVLESIKSNEWLRSSLSQYANDYENVGIEDAIKAVRAAVRAGILCDLGSGSHVDICVIAKEEVRCWRERMVSSWEQEQLEKTDHHNLMTSDEIKQREIFRSTNRFHAEPIDVEWL